MLGPSVETYARLHVNEEENCERTALVPRIHWARQDLNSQRILTISLNGGGTSNQHADEINNATNNTTTSCALHTSILSNAGDSSSAASSLFSTSKVSTLYDPCQEFRALLTGDAFVGTMNKGRETTAGGGTDQNDVPEELLFGSALSRSKAKDLVDERAASSSSSSSSGEDEENQKQSAPSGERAIFICGDHDTGQEATMASLAMQFLDKETRVTTKTSPATTSSSSSSRNVLNVAFTTTSKPVSSPPASSPIIVRISRITDVVAAKKKINCSSPTRRCKEEERVDQNSIIVSEKAFRSVEVAQQFVKREIRKAYNSSSREHRRYSVDRVNNAADVGRTTSEEEATLSGEQETSSDHQRADWMALSIFASPTTALHIVDVSHFPAALQQEGQRQSRAQLRWLEYLFTIVAQGSGIRGSIIQHIPFLFIALDHNM